MYKIVTISCITINSIPIVKPKKLGFRFMQLEWDNRNWSKDVKYLFCHVKFLLLYNENTSFKRV